MVKFVDRLASWTALVGGLVLLGLVLLACTSIVGRSINALAFMDGTVSGLPWFGQVIEQIGISSISGDFEMIEAGVAFAIFCFLPYCQLRAGHATVDLFTSYLSSKINLYIVTFWEIVMAAVIILISWRLYDGLQSMIRSGETSMLLQFPIWWAYSASFAASLITVFVAIYCALAHVLECITGKSYLPQSQGAVH